MNMNNTTGFSLSEIPLYIVLLALLITITMRSVVYYSISMTTQEKQYQQIVQRMSALEKMKEDIRHAPASLEDWIEYGTRALCWRTPMQEQRWFFNNGTLSYTIKKEQHRTHTDTIATSIDDLRYTYEQYSIGSQRYMRSVTITLYAHSQCFTCRIPLIEKVVVYA
jgi:type II secretory pathway pseudopilin PulG